MKGTVKVNDLLERHGPVRQHPVVEGIVKFNDLLEPPGPVRQRPPVKGIVKVSYLLESSGSVRQHLLEGGEAGALLLLPPLFLCFQLSMPEVYIFI